MKLTTYILLYYSIGECRCCNDFMTLLPTRKPWKNDREPCEDSFFEVDDQVRLLSSQMIDLKSTLTVYTNYGGGSKCTFAYPNIFTQKFDAMELFREYGFNSEIDIMNSWDYVGYTRSSDILRLLLSHKYRKSYIDTDIFFLNTTKELYMKPFVGAAMWNDQKCSIEVTNSAFCLPREALEDLIDFLKRRIASNNNTYFYTELGPSMFHKVLMNKHPVVLMSQNHPQEHLVDDIISGVKLYRHPFLHLTGHIRVSSAGMTYLDLIKAIQVSLSLPPSDVPPSTMTITKDDYFEASYGNLLLFPYNLKAWAELGEHLKIKYMTSLDAAGEVGEGRSSPWYLHGNLLTLEKITFKYLFVSSCAISDDVEAMRATASVYDRALLCFQQVIRLSADHPQINTWATANMNDMVTLHTNYMRKKASKNDDADSGNSKKLSNNADANKKKRKKKKNRSKKTKRSSSSSQEL